jgi:hypothetical protein
MPIAFLLLSLSVSLCETAGVHVEFGATERDLAEAYYDSWSDSGSHYIVLTGSFLPKVDGFYLFNVTCTVYFTSQLEPAVAHLEWDDQLVKSGKDSWTWSTTLQKDYRYPFKCTTDDNFYYATLRLDVTTPSGETITVNHDYSDTCTVLGCRNLSLSRDQNCQPPASYHEPQGVTVRTAQKESVLGRGGIVAIGAVVLGVVASLVAVFAIKRRKAALAGLDQALLVRTEGDAQLGSIGAETPYT